MLRQQRLFDNSDIVLLLARLLLDGAALWRVAVEAVLNRGSADRGPVGQRAGAAGTLGARQTSTTVLHNGVRDQLLKRRQRIKVGSFSRSGSIFGRITRLSNLGNLDWKM